MPHVQSPSTEARAPAGQLLCRAVQRALARELPTDSAAVCVSQKDGVVTLAGTVRTWRQRIEATKATHRVKGVLTVADELVVQPRRHGLSDSQIAHLVRSCLTSDGLIHSEPLHVTVSDGWVTLHGSVGSDAERRLAVSSVALLRDVRGVRDEIDVRPAHGSDER